jgi:YVTN family beta-propeller protein
MGRAVVTMRSVAQHRGAVALFLSSCLLIAACSSAGHSASRSSRSRRVPPTTPSNSTNIYAAAGKDMLSPAVRGVPYRLYAPDSGGDGVDVIDPTAGRVIDHFKTGLNPQHVVPSWDLTTPYVTNDLANTLTPIDPMTGKPSGPDIPVHDPYNLYFTSDGAHAIVVAEAQQRLDFRDPYTFTLTKQVPVDCKGVDHADFSADGTYLIATCEFSGKLVKVDLRTETVVGYPEIGGSPQDIKLDPEGRIFYVADMLKGGVHEIDAATFTDAGFIPTGKDAHGVYPSRDAKVLYVSNRRGGSVTVIDFATRQPVATWNIPGGGSPDMGGVSPDGTMLWLSGRYNDVIYGFSTTDGRLLAKVPAGRQPHGMCVWPQPGSYSLGHTGVTR